MPSSKDAMFQRNEIMATLRKSFENMPISKEIIFFSTSENGKDRK